MSCFVFKDQRRFMQACQQFTADEKRYDQLGVDLYVKLIKEEAVTELDEAVALSALPGEAEKDFRVRRMVKLADVALDTIVVAIGLLESMGLDGEPLWDEVIRSNMAKIDPETGLVDKREDGKVLKPEGWTPPDLRRLIVEQLGGLK